MRKFLFLLPFLMDFSAGAFGALCVIFSQQSGASYFFLGPLLGSLPPAAYGLTCYLLGKWIRNEHVRPCLIGSTLAGLFFCVLQLLVPDYRVTAVTLTLLTVALGFFYLPYEILLMQLPRNQTPLRASAMYNLAWSLGFAAGSWLGGALLNVSRTAGFLLPVLGILCLIVVLYYYREVLELGQACRLAAGGAVTTGPSVTVSGPHPAIPLATIEYYLVVGWTCIFTYSFVSSYLRTVYVKTVDGFLGLTPAQIGQLMGLQVLAITLVSGLIYAFPQITYRKGPVVLAMGVMVLSGGLIALLSSFFTVMIGFILVGVYGAFAYVTGVTYGGSHPQKRARALSINQVLIGLGFLTGPLATGLGANADYRIGLGIILAVIVLHGAILTWWLARR